MSKSTTRQAEQLLRNASVMIDSALALLGSPTKKARPEPGKKKKRQCGTPWRFRGITRDAEHLGVTRPHLYLVLSGKRPGKSLMRRYRELKQQQLKQQANAA